MAEDDDDETFGDFSFAPYQSTSKSLDPDDDWGDFLGSSQQSNSSDRETHASPPEKLWVKPRGALPLSIFGGADEEEEEKGNSGFAWGFDRGKSSGVNAGDFNSNLGGKDLPNSQNLNIADLYTRLAQITPEQGCGTDSIAASASVFNQAHLRSIQEASESAVSESKSVDLYDKGGVEDKNPLTNKSGVEEIDFKSHLQDRSKKEDLSGSWTREFYGVSSNLSTSSPNLHISSSGLDANSQKQQLEGSEDGFDDEWEFRDANTEKVDNNEVSNKDTHSSASVIDSRKSHDVIGTRNGSMDFFFLPSGSVDFFATSSGFPSTSMEMNFFGNQMGAATPNGWTFDTKSNIDQTNNNSLVNHSPDVGIGDIDEDFGEFKAASAEMESKALEASTNGVLSPPEAAASIPDGKLQVDFMVPEVSKRNVNSSGSVFGESNGSSDLFATSAGPVDFFANSNSAPSTSNEVDLFGFQSTALSGFDFDTSSNIEQIDVKDTLKHTPDFGSGEMDEDFGEFTAAAVETGPKPGVDLMVDEAAESRANSFVSTSGSKKSLDMFEMSNGSTNFFGTTESVDLFAPPSGIPNISMEVDLNGMQTSSATSNGFTHEINSTIEQNSIKGALDHITDVGDLEFDDDFGEFTAASAQIGSENLENDTKSNYQKGAIPLFIFGNDDAENEEPQTGGSSDVQDMLMYQSSSNKRNGYSPATVSSINDLISSLYIQSEQVSSMNELEKQTNMESSLSNAIPNSSVEHFEDSMWDFQDATQTGVGSGHYLNEIGDMHTTTSSQLKLNNYLNFYLKLKEELCFVIKRHIEDLRHAGDSAFSGEDTRAASLDNEFQLVCKDLEQLKLPFEESDFQGCASEESLKKFVGVLQEPQFQILESEYHLLNKLLLAEKNENSAMELLRHTTTMLKILTTGTSDERKAYISIWYEMISVCAQELRHGASIWNQAAEKQVQSHLLSEPQGRKYLLCLGEIYRVVAVLEASAKLYKPWTLSGALDLPAIYTLLEDCHSIWSSSGLEEGLSSISSPTDAVSLLQSIEQIRSLDALALQNYVHKKKQPLCWLSLLTAEVVPGVKMTTTTWEENQLCFVTVANLWANMITRNPPKLPQLSIP